jgi:hypothetical protein
MLPRLPFAQFKVSILVSLVCILMLQSKVFCFCLSASSSLGITNVPIGVIVGTTIGGAVVLIGLTIATLVSACALLQVSDPQEAT